jgi:hypothetical protein
VNESTLFVLSQQAADPVHACLTSPHPRPPLNTGADLQAAAGNVGNSLPQGARGYLGYVTTHINSPQVGPTAAVPSTCTTPQNSYEPACTQAWLCAWCTSDFKTVFSISTSMTALLLLSPASACLSECAPPTPLHHPPHPTPPTHPHTTPHTTPQILPFLEAAVEARAEIAPALAGNRDLLYLDVALENSIRGAAERGVGSAGALWGMFGHALV